MGKGKSGILAMAAIAAAALGAAGAEAARASQFVFRGYGKFANDNRDRSTKRYPSMVGSSREEIAEWNRNVKTRQVLRHQARHA
jgi:hypothetical protein